MLLLLPLFPTIYAAFLDIGSSYLLNVSLIVIDDVQGVLFIVVSLHDSLAIINVYGRVLGAEVMISVSPLSCSSLIGTLLSSSSVYSVIESGRTLYKPTRCM